MTAAIINADCLVTLRAMPDNSVDAIVTDPPYGLSNIKPERVTEAIVAWATGDRERVPDGRGFMGKAWDSFVPPPAVWDECLRVLKPGGHLVAFAGSRTHDLMGLSIRMAGFEIRDGLAWLYGSGFPKSMDVSKAIDKAAGAERTEKLRPKNGHENFVGRDNVKSLRESGALSGDGGYSRPWMSDPDAVERAHWEYAPASPEAAEWSGWGTALKPAFEPVTLARKPLEGTVAANVLKWGTGALNIDGCRIATDEDTRRNASGGDNGMNGTGTYRIRERRADEMPKRTGRWPANVVLDEHQAAALDEQSGTSKSSKGVRDPNGSLGYHGGASGQPGVVSGHDDEGGASRFFLVCEGDTMDACGNASTAEPSSSQQSARGDSAPSDAATSASLVDNSSSHSTEPSTSATATESRPRSASDTQAILSTAPRCSPELRQPRHTPTSSPARNAEPSEPTGTTTTTQSLSKSAGSAAPAIFSTTPKQAERGVRALQLDALNSRFIYCSKASSKERPEVDGVKHPTVKPLALMRWLVRLVTPPGGLVLDPFAGSGTTLEAAALEGFSCTGIELDPNYAELCRVRIKRADEAERDLFGEAS